MFPLRYLLTPKLQLVSVTIVTNLSPTQSWKKHLPFKRVNTILPLVQDMMDQCAMPINVDQCAINSQQF